MAGHFILPSHLLLNGKVFQGEDQQLMGRSKTRSKKKIAEDWTSKWCSGRPEATAIHDCKLSCDA